MYSPVAKGLVLLTAGALACQLAAALAEALTQPSVLVTVEVSATELVLAKVLWWALWLGHLLDLEYS